MSRDCAVIYDYGSEFDHISSLRLNIVLMNKYTELVPVEYKGFSQRQDSGQSSYGSLQHELHACPVILSSSRYTHR